MKTTIQIIIAGLCLTLAACNKKMPVEKKESTAVKQQDNKMPGIDPAANPANPYDHIGILHNELLDSVGKYKQRSRDTTFKGTLSFLQSCVRIRKNATIESSAAMPVMDKATGIRIIQDYHSYMLRPEFSKEAQTFTRSLMAALDGITGPEGYERYKAAILQTEQQIMASGVSPLEKRYLLTTASVMRHSGYHWMKGFSGQLIQKKGFLGFLRKVAGVITAIAADATVVGWHVVKGSDYDVLIEETVTWSEICGYYTGWYPELPY